MIRNLLFLIIFAIIGKNHGKGVPAHIKYLIQYGYLEIPEKGDAPDLFSDDDIDSALKTAQKFGGIPATGKLDNDTIKMISAPRCGLPDTGSRVKRYGTREKWLKRRITYGFINYSPQMWPEQIEYKIRKAFATWGKPSGLKFFQGVAKKADMRIGFYVGDHGDGDSFDGPGHILAHAGYPDNDNGSDIHFDDDERWTLDESQGLGFSFLPVAIHEMGHALGLQHSYIPGSVMRPRYTPQTHLGYDDISGIQSLYIT